MIKLRPYQENSIRALRNEFKNSQRVILCLPTGSGKTVIFSEMVRLAVEKGTQTLVLTDRVELFKQTIKSLKLHNIPIQEITAKTKGFVNYAPLTLAMVETIKRRDLDNYSPNLIICDEAHKGNFNKVFEQYPKAKVIGATATPVGNHLFKYYQSIVCPIDIPELIEQGYLSNCKAYQMIDDFSDLEVKNGEYTDKSLFNHFNDRKLFIGVVENWKKFGNNKKTIVFNVNIEHTEQMTKEFNDSGIVSFCVTSNTPTEERQRILNDFKNGVFPVLNNCGILTTGYDEPSIEVVIMNRKTKSLPLWLQCCGRGSRIYPNKEYFTILDFGMNHDEHGMWQEERIWTLEKKKKKKGVAPVKSCSNCEAVNPASVRNCIICGFEFEKVVEVQKETTGKMVEITIPTHIKGRRIADMDIDELIELQKLKKYKASFIWRVVRSKGSLFLSDYAHKMKYSSGWLYRQNMDLENSNFNNYIVK